MSYVLDSSIFQLTKVLIFACYVFLGELCEHYTLSAQQWTLKKFRHRTLLDGINNTDHGPPVCLCHLRRSTL